MSKRRKRTIAPRLASGDPRVPFWLNLPPPVKIGIHAIAHMEKKSASWVVETIVVEFFNFDVEYKLKEGRWEPTETLPSTTSARRRKRRKGKGSRA